MTADYHEFVERKFRRHIPTGITGKVKLLKHLMPFQRDLTACALRRGRSALFTDTGTGKTHCELAWADAVARHTKAPVLILAPLAVAGQTVRLAEQFGVAARRINDAADVGRGVNVTNYDKLHRFDPSVFSGVVLDEGSVLKDYTSATRGELTAAFSSTPFRLSASATPAPNDWTELGTQAEFLGIRTREEMLAEFFVHDGGSTQDWRIKGHAVALFWEWVASWALVLRKPSDLGYEDGGFDLPALRIHERIVELGSDYAKKSGTLFVEAAAGLSEQRKVRRDSADDRVRMAAELVAAEPEEQWLIWGEMNDECDAAERSIHGAVQVAGKDSNEDKETRLLDFAEGRAKVLVSKPGICGAGLNFQRCARMIFLGASHSYERVYQATRRCWRYGQTRPVDVYFIATDADRLVLENLKRKEQDAQQLSHEASKYVADLTRAAVSQTKNEKGRYSANVPMRIPSWLREEKMS